MPLRVRIDRVEFFNGGGVPSELESHGGDMSDRIMTYLAFREIPKAEQEKKSSVNEMTHAYVAYSHHGKVRVAAVPRGCLIVETWRKDVTNETFYATVSDLGPELLERFINLYGITKERATVPKDAGIRSRRNRVVPNTCGGVERRPDSGDQLEVTDGRDPTSALIAIFLHYVCPPSWLKNLEEIDAMYRANEIAHDHSMMVVLDTETTGLETPPIEAVVEIGAVVMIDGKVLNSFQVLIRPDDRYLDKARVAICANISGITLAMMKDGVPTDEAGEQFASWLAECGQNLPIHAYNNSFDKRFMCGVGINMNARMAARGCAIPEWGECIQRASALEAKRMGFGEVRNTVMSGRGDQRTNLIRLVDACAMMKIPEAGKAHRADVDAMNAALLYTEILKRREARRKKFMEEG